MKRGQHLTAAKLPPLRLRFGAGFILLISIIYFFDTEGIIAALMPAVAVHELGHMAVLIFLGAPPRRLTACLSGFSMDYVGNLSGRGELAAALGGPFFGLGFAFFCAWCGRWLESDFLLMSAGLGCVLNLFNLLPARPLDGGKALSALLGMRLLPRTVSIIMAALGLTISAALIAAGAVMAYDSRGFGLIVAGIWLLIIQKNELL